MARLWTPGRYSGRRRDEEGRAEIALLLRASVDRRGRDVRIALERADQAIPDHAAGDGFYFAGLSVGEED